MVATKIYLLGASEVGKSALIERYLNNAFQSEYFPTIEHHYRKTMVFCNKDISLEIIDTGGLEELSTTFVRDMYIKDSYQDCYMFCFDRNNRPSFEYLSRILSHIIKSKKAAQNPPMVLVSCKADLPDQDVSSIQIEQLSKIHTIPYFETTAKEGLGVKEAFDALLKLHLDHCISAFEASKKAATKLSLVDACSCEVVYPKVIQKKLKVKTQNSINDFVNGRTALHAAIGRPEGPTRKQIIKYLLAAGADPFRPPPPKTEGVSVVAHLLQDRDLKRIAELITCGMSESAFASYKLGDKTAIEHILDQKHLTYPPVLIHLITSQLTESAKLSARVCNRVSRDDFTYREEDKLGSGGFGSVYKGTFRSTPAAIKRIDESLHPEDSAFDLTSLRRELAVLSLISGPFLLKYYAYCYEEPNYFIITELADCSLQQYIKDGRLKDFRTKHLIALGVAQGMLSLHNSGIAHRDLKTENILLMNTRTSNIKPKIADFGISRTVSTDKVLQTRSVGTSNYMAPELLESTEIEASSALLKADVYSFGYLLWALWVNEEPHQGQACALVLRSLEASKKKSLFSGKYQTPLKIPSDCPRTWKKIMTSCWEYLPANRPHFQLIVSLLTGEKLKNKKSAPVVHTDGNSGKKLKKSKEDPSSNPKKVKKGSSVDLSKQPDIGEDFEQKSKSIYSSDGGSKLPSLRAVTHLGKKKSHPTTETQMPNTNESTSNSNSNSNSNSHLSHPKLPESYPGQHRVEYWLRENSFEKWTPLFVEHEINMECLVELDKEDLREMGIRKVGVILNILRAIRITLTKDKKK